MPRYFMVIRQELPLSPKPWRLIEKILTSDGIRDRICNGQWATFEEAMDEARRRNNETS